MKKVIKIFIIAILLLAGSSGFALAECSDSQTELEIKLPGLEGCVNGPADYLSGIYKLSLGVGVFMAAIVIVMAGVKYAMSGDNAGKQKEAKDDIFQAIFGLVVLFGSVIILRTINPDLADLSKWQQLPPVSSVASSAALSDDCKEFRQDRANCLKECNKDGRESPKIITQCTEICNRPPAIDPCAEQSGGAK
ncbi:MAG TPA: pilin [Candidatus Paceibacterota bacterium]|nr:pilin [Candidatus Paceibacterota bacterium]HPT40426.1 pilin [Candidatus Paceibacterota bacterium]